MRIHEPAGILGPHESDLLSTSTLNQPFDNAVISGNIEISDAEATEATQQAAGAATSTAYMPLRNGIVACTVVIDIEVEMTDRHASSATEEGSSNLLREVTDPSQSALWNTTPSAPAVVNAETDHTDSAQEIDVASEP